jgi:hypothetical protein
MSDSTPKLTHKQSRFIEAYLANGCNATQAARLAGYKVRQSAAELMTYPHIISAIQEKIAQTPIVSSVPAKRVSCYLYLMQAANGLIKIGIAADPQLRLGQINTGSPIEVNLLDAFADATAKLSETELHRLFVDKRVKGEWFALSEEDIAYIRRRCEGS